MKWLLGASSALSVLAAGVVGLAAIDHLGVDRDANERMAVLLSASPHWWVIAALFLIAFAWYPDSSARFEFPRPGPRREYDPDEDWVLQKQREDELRIGRHDQWS